MVIGHVDHGKTALVRALTGIETDRLPEEKARGLTITPGFAHHIYATGAVDFVDAPGHVDFIQAMICAASGAQAVLLIVSAVEGARAQTREHLLVAGMLGLKCGVIALTKADLVTPTEMAKRQEEIRELVAETALAAAPIIPCSGPSGMGLDALHRALEQLLTQAPDTPAPLHPYLPIDRVFTLPGRGTIVTGTLMGRAVSRDEKVVLQPGGQATKLRGLQSRGFEMPRVEPGTRVAANIRGVAVDDVSRGAVISAPDCTIASTCFDVQITMQEHAPHPLKHMQETRFFVGTASVIAQVRVFGTGALKPGETGFGQLRLAAPVAGFEGQRGVIRSLSPAQTVAGIVCLDTQAKPTSAGDKARKTVLHAAARQDAGQIAQALIGEGGGIASKGNIARLARVADPALDARFVDLPQGCVTDQGEILAWRARLVTSLAAYHHRYPRKILAPRSAVLPKKTAAALADHVETQLRKAGTLRGDETGVALTEHDPFAVLSAAEQDRMQEIAHLFEATELAPPQAATVEQSPADADLIALLLFRGDLIALENVALRQRVLLHSTRVKQAALRLSEAFPAQQSFTTSQARIALATSRRIIVPLLEHFDKVEVTRRSENTRHIVGKPSLGG